MTILYDPDAAPIRGMRRVSVLLRNQALRTEFCSIMREVESQLWKESEEAIGARDAKDLNAKSNELDFITRSIVEVCRRVPIRARVRGRVQRIEAI